MILPNIFFSRCIKCVLTLASCIFCLTIALCQPTIDSTTIKNLQDANEASKKQIQVLNKEIADLKQAIQKQQRQGFDKFYNCSAFLDAAISSTNNLQTLVLKESYRNKIVALNNPTSNELGFNLEAEIQNSLKPLQAKTTKTNNQKLNQVVSSVMQTGKNSVGLFSAGNVFTSLISMVGNITMQEKKIEKEDLDNFIKSIEKYFNQCERLQNANKKFTADMDKLKTRLTILQEDIQLQLIDLIVATDKTIKRKAIKKASVEDLMLQYFDSRRLQETFAKLPMGTQIQFPQDAVKGCKEIANTIQRIYDEYQKIYDTNYKEIRSVIADTKAVGSGIDQLRLNTTLKEVETLYTESKSTDAINLRLKTLFERLEIFIM